MGKNGSFKWKAEFSLGLFRKMKNPVSEESIPFYFVRQWVYIQFAGMVSTGEFFCIFMSVNAESRIRNEKTCFVW